jgi:hypothetical protein
MWNESCMKQSWDDSTAGPSNHLLITDVRTVMMTAFIIKGVLIT